MRIEIRKSKSLNPFNQYYYVIVGANNEDMSKGESYFSKANCARAAHKMAMIIQCAVVDTTVKPYKKFGA